MRSRVLDRLERRSCEGRGEEGKAFLYAAIEVDGMKSNRRLPKTSRRGRTSPKYNFQGA